MSNPARRVLGGLAARAPARLRGTGPGSPPLPPGWYDHIALDYPVEPRSRAGHGLPTNPFVGNLIERGRGTFARNLEAIAGHADAVLTLPVPDARGLAGPPLDNQWLPLLDIAALYTMVVDRRPATFLEVGSGTSTLVAARAIRDAGIDTRIVSIDPEPRREVDDLCDEVVRSPLETADLGVFEELEPGDVVFVDNSHRALPNSDVTVFFLEVMPRIPSGVMVEIHDIYLPDDYPPGWSRRFYSEQFVLAAFLLGGAEGWAVELPCWFAYNDPELVAIVEPMIERSGLGEGHRHGGSFWLRRT